MSMDNEDYYYIDGVKYDILFDFKAKKQAEQVAERVKELGFYKNVKVVYAYKENEYFVIGQSK